MSNPSVAEHLRGGRMLHHNSRRAAVQARTARRAVDLDPTARDGAEQEMQAVRLMRSIRHPFLLSMERIEVLPDLLVIVMELADHSLHDQFLQAREAGLPGIPRQTLLGYMQET